MPDKFDIVARMARLDAVDANRIPIRRITCLAAIKVVHREGRVAGNLVQTLTARDRLLHLVLVVEDLVAAHYRLNAARQAQTSKLIVEDLIKFERCRGIVRDLYASRQSIEDPIPTQYRVALRRD